MNLTPSVHNGLGAGRALGERIFKAAEASANCCCSRQRNCHVRIKANIRACEPDFIPVGGKRLECRMEICHGVSPVFACTATCRVRPNMDDVFRTTPSVPRRQRSRNIRLRNLDGRAACGSCIYRHFECDALRKVNRKEILYALADYRAILNVSSNENIFICIDIYSNSGAIRFIAAKVKPDKRLRIAVGISYVNIS